MLRNFARQLKYFLSKDYSTDTFVKYFCGLFDTPEAPVGVKVVEWNMFLPHLPLCPNGPA